MNNQLKLEISVSNRETSKDSNSQNTLVKLENGTVNFEWSYWGFHPDSDFERNKKWKMKLNDEQLKKIIQLIDEYDLFRNINESQTSENIGRSIELSCKIELSGKTGDINIAGMTSIWHSQELKSNIKNIKLVENIEHIVFMFRHWREN